MECRSLLGQLAYIRGLFDLEITHARPHQLRNMGADPEHVTNIVADRTDICPFGTDNLYFKEWTRKGEQLYRFHCNFPGFPLDLQAFAG